MFGISTLLRCLTVVVISLLSNLLFAGGDKGHALNLPVDAAWGNPEYREYKSTNKSREWTYTQQDATLIFTRTECAACVKITTEKVAEYNSIEKNMSSVMLSHKEGPAMLHMYASPKNGNFRVFQIVVDGYQYEIQLGISNKVADEYSLRLERDFYRLINSFSPSQFQ